MFPALTRFVRKPWFGQAATPAVRKAVPLRVEALEERSVPSTVNVTNMTSDNGSTAGTLRHALENATSGEIIDITVPGTLKLMNGPLDVNVRLTINGLGASQDIVNGQQLNEDFNFTALNISLTMSGMTVTGGKTTGTGGGIDAPNTGDSVNLTNCTISNNSASQVGGGVAVNGNAAFTGCTFSGNKAGTADFDNGGGFFALGNVVLVNCTFLSNTTGGEGGGGFSAGFINASGCTVESNHAVLEEGGGFSAINDITLTNCVMTGNKAGAEGGGVYSLQGNISATGCTISGNVATGAEGGGVCTEFGDVTLSNCTMTGNFAGAEGGAAYCIYGTMTVSHCTITSNTAGAEGGGVCAVGPKTFTGNALTLTNSVLSGNHAGAEGGGAYTYVGSIAATGCTITSNVAKEEGGGLSNHFGNMTVTSCNISGNTGGEGGGVLTKGMLTMTGSTLAGNSAVGGHFTLGGGGGAEAYGNADVVDCTISGNTAKIDGGGITVFNLGVPGKTTFVNDTIANNKSGFGGGLVIADGVTAFVGDCTVAGNAVTTDDLDGGGGILITDDSTMTLENSIVADNSAPAGASEDIAVGPTTDGKLIMNYSLVGNTGGTTFTGANNLLNVNPDLGPLANNGGPTQTMALLPNSPAVNAGSNALIPSGITTDERGYPRIADGTVDMGAYELQFTATTIVSSLNPSTAGQTVTFTATVAFTTPFGTIPPGTLTFYVNGAAVGSSSLNSAGQATLSYTFSAQGSYTVEAIFVPSDGSVGSNDSLTQVVNLPAPVGRRRS